MHLVVVDIVFVRVIQHMRSGARLYIEEGIPPGSFLTAMLENNLSEAAMRADETNAKRLPDFADWMMWDIPSRAWGSKQEVEDWIAQGGISKWKSRS